MNVIVIGSGGQDGRLLSEQLDAEGHAVIGVRRHNVDASKTIRTVTSTVTSMDIRQRDEICSLIGTIRPEQLYYLAAHHHSSEQEPDQPGDAIRKSIETNLIGLVNVLDAVQQISPSTRVFYAASSRVFGQHPSTSMQDETTPFHPECAYGISKAAGIEACRLYRRKHGLFVAAGILYNHESIYRGTEFVSRKITRAAVAASRGELLKLALRDISARVDWGYAPDYVRAMRAILAQNVADDFVIATGQSHSVGEFAEIAFDTVGLDWRMFVRAEQNGPCGPSISLVGNALKLRTLCGWRPSLEFRDMVHVLVSQEKERSNGAR
jgi:GDPmannose 4,6-dehydratase